ncbi:MAG: acyl-CoA carboxylase epsilon subunit [Rhodoluna sp.]|nr:acyl-CoA carboxylase epsilon subunit [Rhodoluna sp.]
MSEELQHLLRVEAGSPTPEELAAVVAVLSAAVAEANEQAAKAVGQPKSSWNRSSNMLRGSLTPGFGQWTASSRPGLD